MGMLRHRPHASNVAVVSLLRNKNGGETLIFKKKGFLLRSLSEKSCDLK
jgi:hypothetical protein